MIVFNEFAIRTIGVILFDGTDFWFFVVESVLLFVLEELLFDEIELFGVFFLNKVFAVKKEDHFVFDFKEFLVFFFNLHVHGLGGVLLALQLLGERLYLLLVLVVLVLLEHGLHVLFEGGELGVEVLVLDLELLDFGVFGDFFNFVVLLFEFVYLIFILV